MDSLKSIKLWFPLLALGSIAISIGSFIIGFYHLKFSFTPAAWATFAGYFSNISTPLISALAVIAFVFTHKQQQKVIEQQNNTIINGQNIANEERILKIITRLEEDLEKLGLRSFDITINGSERKIEIYSMLFSPSDGTFAIYDEVFEQVKTLDKTGLLAFNEQERKLFLLYESMVLAVGVINQIRLHCIQLQEISSHNIYTRYFQRKYKLAWDRILKAKLKTEKWKEPSVQAS